jgi:hypothetical protein
LAGRFSVDLKVERMMAIGTPLLALSAVLLIGLLAAGVDHPFSIFIPIGLSFIGTGIAQPSAISTAIGADPEIGGAASALLGFMQIAFGAIAITLVGSCRRPRLPSRWSAAAHWSSLSSPTAVCAGARSRREPDRLKTCAWRHQDEARSGRNVLLAGKVPVLRHRLPGLRQRSLGDHGRRAEIAVRGVEQGHAVGKRAIGQRLAVDERRLEIARPLARRGECAPRGCACNGESHDAEHFGPRNHQDRRRARCVRSVEIERHRPPTGYEWDR